MQDDKRRLREEKRILKRAGQKHARRNAKRAIRDDPENAQDAGMDYGAGARVRVVRRSEG